ncbi:hypothetical protein ACT3UQ_15880 [Glutamicibacter sp. AOP12-B1-11]|nr:MULTISPECIES: hypothetical protein [unclassified Arthrobacter]
MVGSKGNSVQSPELDSVEWAVPELLQVDESMPNKEIAAKVEVAPTPA